MDLTEISDRLEIEKLVTDYANAVDDRNFAKFNELFTSDAFIDYTAVTASSAPSAISTSDKVKFLFVKNESTADGIYLVLDGGTASNSVADGIFIGAGQTFTGRFPNTTVGNLHAIASDIADVGDANVTAIVAALIDDVG